MAWRRPGDKSLSETNAGSIRWRIYAALGGDDLKYRPKVGHHKGGKWFIHGLEHYKEKH